MALKRVVQKELYRYSEDIVGLTKQDAIDARNLFDQYKKRGIILNETFDDDIWILTNEVHRERFDFSLGKDLYSAKAAKEIGCSYRNFCVAVRVYAVHNLNYSLTTVQARISAIMQFARSVEVPSTDSAAKVVADFLELLPGDTPLRNRVSARAFCRTVQTGASSRNLVDYISYFRFSHYLNQFWSQATSDEKLLYFPIFLWWSLTSILPLRVTEFLLIPRDCIVRRDDSWLIRIRRTKLKNRNGQAAHSIASDYEILEYPILDDLAKEIKAYIDATEDEYASNIDTIFSKQTQWRLTNLTREITTNYTVSNLNHLLDRFYSEILQTKFNLNLVDQDSQPGTNEINRIRLGDTRHIAIINLLVSGSSLVACKELSRHFDIYSAQNYYSNVTSFLKALHFEYLAPTPSETTLPQYTPLPESHALIPDIRTATTIPEGYCASKRYKSGDYSDCALAVNSHGHIGTCSHCKYLIPNKASFMDYSYQADVELKKACALIYEILNSYRTNSETLPDMEGILNNLQTAASQYLRLSVLERQIVLEGGNYG